MSHEWMHLSQTGRQLFVEESALCWNIVSSEWPAKHGWHDSSGEVKCPAIAHAQVVLSAWSDQTLAGQFVRLFTQSCNDTCLIVLYHQILSNCCQSCLYIIIQPVNLYPFIVKRLLTSTGQWKLTTTITSDARVAGLWLGLLWYHSQTLLENILLQYDTTSLTYPPNFHELKETDFKIYTEIGVFWGHLYHFNH